MSERATSVRRPSTSGREAYDVGLVRALPIYLATDDYLAITD
jgi:hypothetical protein